jgi:1-acyl-sn-glycerol-3-phosphate acyltransferase
MHAAGLQFRWAAKDELFRWPLGVLLRWLGGIPVNRRLRTNFVQQIVDAFNQAETFAFAVTPEGTRAKANAWKTGFYHIAMGAGVPVALGYVDYRTRTLGIGPTLALTGDIHADFARIRAFYQDKQGRYPEKQGEIRIDAK